MDVQVEIQNTLTYMELEDLEISKRDFAIQQLMSEHNLTQEELE